MASPVHDCNQTPGTHITPLYVSDLWDTTPQAFIIKSDGSKLKPGNSYNVFMLETGTAFSSHWADNVECVSDNQGGCTLTVTKGTEGYNGSGEKQLEIDDDSGRVCAETFYVAEQANTSADTCQIITTSTTPNLSFKLNNVEGTFNGSDIRSQKIFIGLFPLDANGNPDYSTNGLSSGSGGTQIGCVDKNAFGNNTFDGNEFNLGSIPKGNYTLQVRKACIGLNDTFDAGSSILCEIQKFSIGDTGATITQNGCAPWHDDCSRDLECLPNNFSGANGEPTSFSCQVPSAAPKPPGTSGSSNFTSALPLPAPCASSEQDTNGNCNSIHTALGNISTNVPGFTKWLLTFILSVAGGIVVLIIIATGYKLMASQGDPEKVKEAREGLTSAIVGLLFIIFSLVILQFITQSVLHIPGFN